LLAPLLARGQTQPTPRTGTNAVPVSADRSATTSSKDRLQELEEQLNKALESFSPKGMLDARPEPEFQQPLVPPVSNRHLKAEQDKRKNWMFMEPDDLLSGKSSPDCLNPSATWSEKKKTDLDLFYQRLNRQRNVLKEKGRLNPDDLMLLSNDGRSDEPGFHKEEKLPEGVKGPASKLRDLLGSDPSASPAARTSLSDFLGLNQNALTPEQVQAHKNLMDEYRKILPGSTAAATPLNAAAPSSAQGMPSVTSGLAGSVPTTPGMVGTIFNPSIIPDRNATVLNQWNPLYAPPKVEPPKPPPFIEPPAEAPRRKF
jgi:hypothetical protein